MKSRKGISKMSSEIQEIKKDSDTTNIVQLQSYSEFNAQTFWCLMGFLFYLAYITGYLLK